MLDAAVHGDPSLPALVLLHAGGMTRREWDPFLPGWQEQFRLVTLTAPGHGASPRVATLTLDSLIAATIETLDALGIGRAHFLGSSMGGATALRIALQYPERVDRLILYRSGFRTSPGAREALGRMATAENWRRWGLARWMEREHEPQGGPAAWEAVIGRVAEAFAHADASLTATDLARVQTPVLLIGGDRDDLVPAEDLMAMYRAFPRARLWMVPGGGHLLAMETWRRPAFLAEVRRFLQALD
jgi:3-oxoadipate enol-lactonase